MKIIIVGGVAGGASAAARARRLSESAEIILLERGPDVSFANCGLPYYIGGSIADRQELLVTTPQQFQKRYNIDVRTRNEVIAIDRSTKTVHIQDLIAGRAYQEPYDKLLLAPGAAPIRLSLPGIDLPGVFSLRSLEDADRIQSAVGRGAKQAVVVGGGFIGLELVENFVRRGLQVTVVELQDQILPPFDREMTTPVLKSLQAHGVTVLLNDSAEAIQAAPFGLSVGLRSGRKAPAQVVVIGVGVRSENRLAVDAGLSVGKRGGIIVNEFLQTGDEDIYAVGDAIEVVDYVLRRPTQAALAGPANRQGRIAAGNMLGRRAAYRGTQGTAIVRAFECVAAMTGATEKVLQQLQRPYQKAFVHPTHHAGYYPGAEVMTLKLLFEPDSGRILGAQAVGGAGVDKRIDVISMAIQAGMTVFDLEEAEFAYAPQFGSAKDPVNMAGFVAANLLRGDHPQIDVLELAGDEPPYLLDVRTSTEYAAGSIPGAVNIPLDELRDRLAELPAGRRIAAYCQVGQRGYLATRILLQAGFHAVNVSGGYRLYDMHLAADPSTDETAALRRKDVAATAVNKPDPANLIRPQ